MIMKGTDQPRARRHRDHLDRSPSGVEGLVDEIRQRLEVFARRQLGHNAAEWCVRSDLACQLVGLDTAVAIEHCYRGLVARGLDGDGASQGISVGHGNAVWQSMGIRGS